MDGFSQPRFRNDISIFHLGVDDGGPPKRERGGERPFSLSPMTVKAMSEVMELQLPTKAKFVLLCIANHVDDYYVAFPSIGTLSRHTCIPERTLQRSLAWLIDNNYLLSYWDYHPNDRLRQRPIRFFRLNLSGKPVTIRPDYSNCPVALRKEVIQRFNHTCAYCHQSGSDTKGPDGKTWEIDRIVPGKQGGGYTADNVTLACAKCNRAKGAKVAPQGGARPDSVSDRIGTTGVPNETDPLSEMAPYPSLDHPSLKPSLDPPYSSDVFLGALSAFERHRTDMKKPLTREALKLLYRKLARWGESVATQALEDAVINRWQGVFEPRETNGRIQPNGVRPLDAAERNAARYSENLEFISDLRRNGGRDHH